MVTEILLAVVLVMLSFIIVIVYRRGKVGSEEIAPALSKAWMDSGLDRRVGELTTIAGDIRGSHQSIQQMLRVPRERASFGELALEEILSDQLPPDMFTIRERVLDGKAPDATIRSTVGLICIDSKFPLENFARIDQAAETGENDQHKRQFLRDVQGHLDKIATDYVRPQEGSAEFAFAYIPSEAVYYFLLCEAFDMLRNYTHKGVQVVSPLTLSHKVELIRAGVLAKKLSDDAAKVQEQLRTLGSDFQRVDEEWRILTGHLRNAGNKVGDVDEAYRKVREDFDRVSSISD